jgi:signal transduction histidine kinase
VGAVVTIVDITAMKVLDRLKREFVAKVSHELRSPLSTIHEQLAVVLSDLVGQVSPADEHLLSRAKEKTQGLIALIGDLLDLSRIEAGRYELHEETIRLADVAEDCERLVKLKADSKGLQIVEDFAMDLPQVWADPRAPVALEAEEVWRCRGLREGTTPSSHRTRRCCCATRID